MNKLIVTRADDDVAEMTALTHPMLRRYASRLEADFMTLKHTTDCYIGDGIRHFRIMALKELLDDYDRILCIDSDVVLTKHCPNVFDEVPYDSVGVIYEDIGSRQNDRRQHIQSVQRYFGDVGWTKNYINTGVFVVSKTHQNIFEKIDDQYWTTWGTDDVHLGWQIHKHGHQVHELSFKWNHMTMFSEEWNNSADRFQSYVIHYAGNGIFDRTHKNKMAQMRADMQNIYHENLCDL